MAQVKEAEEPESKEIIVRVGSSEEKPENIDPFTIKLDKEALAKITTLAPDTRRRLNRKLSKAYTGIDDAQGRSMELGYYTAYSAFGVIQPIYNLDYLAQIYELSPANYAAINAKVANIIGLGYEFKPTQKVIDKLANASSSQKRANIQKQVDLAKQTLEALLEDLNAENSVLEVLRKVWIDYETTGNGYIEIGRTSSGKIGYFGHVAATSMRVRTMRDGYVQMIGPYVIFFRNYGDLKTVDPVSGQKVPNEILHIKKYTPRDTYYGIPDVVPAAKALAGDEFAARFNLDYFEYKAVPRYVITLKGASLSKKSEDALVEFFQTNLKGKNHRTLYVPLPPDDPQSKVEFKMEAVEAGKQDASFGAYRKANMDEIFMTHRVPRSKAGMAEGMSLAAAKDADKGFKEQVTRPEQGRLETLLTPFIAEFTDMFILKFNELTLTDEDTQSKIIERLVRMQVMLPNEARALLGLPPRDGGDKPVNLTAQGAADQTAVANQSRTRDQNRAANQSDAGTGGRNAQGDGRATP